MLHPCKLFIDQTTKTTTTHTGLETREQRPQQYGGQQVYDGDGTPRLTPRLAPRPTLRPFHGDADRQANPRRQSTIECVSRGIIKEGTPCIGLCVLGDDQRKHTEVHGVHQKSAQNLHRAAGVPTVRPH